MDFDVAKISFLQRGVVVHCWSKTVKLILLDKRLRSFETVLQGRDVLQ